MSFITHFTCSHFPVLKYFPILLCNTHKDTKSHKMQGKKTLRENEITYFLIMCFLKCYFLWLHVIFLKVYSLFYGGRETMCTVKYLMQFLKFLVLFLLQWRTFISVLSTYQLPRAAVPLYAFHKDSL